ncbi:MAG: adenosylcobalamin-dependent ribonucleoside-diphosphate reductase [Gammaproteobacteria bacterium]|nr:adenosylcobalamin-dependent ribonucleoside-diphosphate reductase [Gammaproteobacteria bacterium]
MARRYLRDELSRYVWASKYRYRPPAGDGGAPKTLGAEESIADTWDRVADALASVEGAEARRWRRIFRDALEDFAFLPAGRILAGAGTERRVTLFNCFVMGFIEDSVDDIFEHLKQGAVTMQWGGGIGVDFSTLRPRGTEAVAHGAIASGPVSFMRIWDAMCATMLSTGSRRGAMMGTLRCDHPDVADFVDAKRERGALTNFNLSVQVTDALMRAVEADEPWPLCFPFGDTGDEREAEADSAHGPRDGDVSAASRSDSGYAYVRWPGRESSVACRVVERVPARALWQRIMDAAYDTAEPGVLYVDRINRHNNLYYREHITSTNPCGEIPLPAYGACDLGSVNLTRFVRRPFSQRAELDIDGIEETARVATRMLDDVVDLSHYPLPEQALMATSTRRVGLGVTGLGDALIMLGLRYDSDAARQAAAEVLTAVRDAAYRQSIALAKEKGAFPLLDKDAHLAGRYVSSLPPDIRDDIARHGIRNSHLLAIAPTGTISLLANNVSSGIEPVFSLTGERRVIGERGEPETHPTTDFAYALWRREPRGPLPPAFVTADELPPEAHLAMAGALQPLVDNSISKTINVPERISRAAFADIYRRAYELGLKGCTVFRPNPVTGAVLSHAPARVHCCTPDREGD